MPVTDDYLPDLLRWEGRYSWLYLDVRGYPTIGIGNLVSTGDACARLPLMVPLAAKGPARPATDAEKRGAWATVNAMEPALRPKAYAKASALRLADAEIDALCRTRLEREFLPGVRRLFPGFDGYPRVARTCLVDLAYNLGVGRLGSYRQLQKACEASDWQRAAEECAVSSSRPARNDWRREQMLRAALGVA